MVKLNIRRLSVLLVCAVMSAMTFAGGAPAAPLDSKPARPRPPLSSSGLSGTLSLGPLAIVNVATEKCIDIPGYGPGTAGGPVNQYTCDNTSADNQLFTFDDSIRAHYYNIRNVKDDLCLDVPNYGPVTAGTPVSEYPCDYSENDNQQYILIPRPNGTDWILNWLSGLCLDVAGFRSTANNARITLYYCNDLDDHQWAGYPPA